MPNLVANMNPYAASSPDYQAQALDLQRRQALAQALTEDGQTQIQFDPRGRISPLQGLSKLASGLMGAYMANDNVQRGAKLQALSNALLAQGGFNLGGGNDDQPTSGSGSGLQISNGPSRQAPTWTGGMSGGASANPQGSAPTPLPAPMPQASSGNAGGQGYGTSAGGTLTMPGMTNQQSYAAYLADPTGFMQALIARSDQRTDFSKLMLSAGIDPNSPMGRTLIAGQLAKINFVAPIEMRPGGGLMDPKSGQVTTMPAAAPGGFQNVQLADGSWGTVPVRGGADAITQSTAAGEAGKAPFQIVDTFQNGKPGRNFAGNVLPLPVVGGTQSGAAPSFDLGGTPQQQAAILTDISQRGATPEIRAAASLRMQALRSNPGGANGVQTGPGIGEAQGAVNAQDELSKGWAQQQQAHAAAQSNIYTLQSLKGLADSAITGSGKLDPRSWFAKLGAYVGIPDAEKAATSSDLMDKYSAQLIAGLSARGMSTDAARELVMMGTPGAHMQPAAIKEAVDGLIAREQMTQARTAVLQPWAANRDPAGYQATANRFDAVADPRLWQMRGMNPQQLQAFTAKLPANEAAQLAARYQQATQSGYLQ